VPALAGCLRCLLTQMRNSEEARANVTRVKSGVVVSLLTSSAILSTFNLALQAYKYSSHLPTVIYFDLSILITKNNGFS
jgi:hypothetical protein